MLPISTQARFFLYSEAVDMRKSFDGLHGLVIDSLNMNPLSGDVYIFINRRRNRIKLLVWDRSGYWLLYKRLEKGHFQPLDKSGSSAMELSYESLIMLLEGIDLLNVKRRKRYRKTA